MDIQDEEKIRFFSEFQQGDGFDSGGSDGSGDSGNDYSEVRGRDENFGGWILWLKWVKSASLNRLQIDFGN